jgi:hypothetical protein
MSDLEEPLETPQEENTCRICLEPGELLQPCDCKTSYVHKECLLKWLNTSRRTNCEVCLFEYNIKLNKPPLLLFSYDPILNRNIIILGIFGLFPISPFAFYMKFKPLDIYYAINILFVCLVFAYVRYVKICQTLAFWKICLTAGFTIVAAETGRYDHILFDYGISAIFILDACFCDSRFLRPINNEDNSENE